MEFAGHILLLWSKRLPVVYKTDKFTDITHSGLLWCLLVFGCWSKGFLHKTCPSKLFHLITFELSSFFWLFFFCWIWLQETGPIHPRSGRPKINKKGRCRRGAGLTLYLMQWRLWIRFCPGSFTVESALLTGSSSFLPRPETCTSG